MQNLRFKIINKKTKKSVWTTIGLLENYEGQAGFTIGVKNDREPYGVKNIGSLSLNWGRDDTIAFWLDKDHEILLDDRKILGIDDLEEVKLS